MAVTAPTLVLRCADVGIATYVSLRLVGAPDTTVTWVIEDAALGTIRDLLSDALPDPKPAESSREAIERAITAGSFANPAAEQDLADILGDAADPRGGMAADRRVRHLAPAALFVAPTARLATVPWTVLASKTQPGDGRRLVELADILMAAPPNIANSHRECAAVGGSARRRAVADP